MMDLRLVKSGSTESSGSAAKDAAELDAILKDPDRRGELFESYHTDNRELVEAFHRHFIEEAIGATFARTWGPHLLQYARQHGLTPAMDYARRGSKVVEAIEDIFRENAGLGLRKEVSSSDGRREVVVKARRDSRILQLMPVLPGYRFKQDIGFREEDRFILAATLHVAGDREFYKLNRVQDAARYVPLSSGNPSRRR